MASPRLRFLGPWLGLLLLVPAPSPWAQTAGLAEGQKLLQAADEALAAEAGMGVVEVSLSVLVGEEPANHRTFQLYRDASRKATLWLFPSADGTLFRGLLAEPSGLSVLDADVVAVRWEALKPTPGQGQQRLSAYGGDLVATDGSLSLAMVGPAGKDDAKATALFRLEWFLPEARAPRYTALSVVPDKVGQVEASLVEAKALDRASEAQSVKLWIDKKNGLVIREERYDKGANLVEKIITQYGRLNGQVLPTKKQVQLTVRDPSGKSFAVKAGFTLHYGQPGPPRFDITNRDAIAKYLRRN